MPPCVLSLGHEFSVGNSLHPPDVGVGKEDTGSPEAGQTTSREGSGVTLPIPEVHWVKVRGARERWHRLGSQRSPLKWIRAKVNFKAGEGVCKQFLL